MRGPRLTILCSLYLAASLGAEPIPRSLQPAAVTAGGPAFTLVVSGMAFANSTRILWDGSPLLTRFESETRLAADIPASRIARPGNVAVGVTRGDQQSSEVLTLAVNPPLEWITAPMLPSAVLNKFYSQAFSISGGTAPLRFSLVSGVAPPGLHFDGYNGIVVGYASLLGQYELSVRAADASGAVASQSFRLTVAGELRVASGPALPATVAGLAYAIQLAADGGTVPMSEWKLTAGALPRGLALDEKNGRIAGVTMAPAGTTQFTVRVRDAAGKTALGQLTLEVIGVLKVAPRDALTDLAEGDPVQLTMGASGGVTPYVWALDSGELPAGLSLDSQTGMVRGTLQKAGGYRPTLRVRDASGIEARGTLEFQVAPAVALSVPLTPDAIAGSAFTWVFTASGGAPPYAWNIVAGKLPDGMRLGSGRLEGTPRIDGEYVFTVEARDRGQRTARAEIRLRVAPPPLPVLLLAPLSRLLPGQQIKLDLRLDRTYPTDLELVVQLAFEGPEDPAILLSTGGRQARVMIPAGQIVPAQALQLQTGTTAGIVTVEAHLASQTAIRSAAVDPLPPQIRSVQLRKTADGFECVVSAFSPTREIDSAVFAFDGGLQITLPIRDLAGVWYADERSIPFGTSFIYRQDFTVRGDASVLRGLSVTLRNRIGASIPSSAVFSAAP